MNKIFALAILLVLCFPTTLSAHNNGRRHNHVGYYPVVRWYPYGTYMGTQAVVSPNRRYVRVGVNVGFSTYRGYSTFNYRTGKTGYYPSRNGNLK